eukprot:6490723-Amphidinium_carterae.2
MLYLTQPRVGSVAQVCERQVAYAVVLLADPVVMVVFHLWRSVALCLLLSPIASATLSDSVDEYAQPDRICLAADDSLRGAADRSATKVVIAWRFD